MSATRIYVVTTGVEQRLVEAASAAQAIRHCVADKYTARPASPKDIAILMSVSVSLEKAGEDATPIKSQSPTGQQQQSSQPY